MIILISKGLVKSVQRELNHFFSVIQGESYDIHEVTKGALTQARAKLKPEAFIELNEVSVREFYDGAPYQSWNGHRLLAVDGSIINLPDHASIAQQFGTHKVGCKAQVDRSMATISICYDVLNLLTLDAQLASFTTSEPTLLQRHLERVSFKCNDLLLMDRGYPSAALIYELQQRKIHYCIRLPRNWKEVSTMLLEGIEDKQIKLKPKGTEQDLQCRLVVIELHNGEKEVLCTSLMDTKIYRREDLKELYHYRWNAEEAYKLLKCRADLEVFSGKTANAVRQDFHAKIFMMTVCAALSYPIAEKVKEEHTKTKSQYPRQINRSNAFAFLRTAWITLWTNPRSKRLLAAMKKILEKSADIIRSNRVFRRKYRSKKPPSMTYKQL